ncbi:hypothetical protein ACJEQE_16815, partial [Klebsiella pneumoniae]|uniref:hypothetical protein n=1 Tax=Klebsiella pneumoniae TaxID=573 RepID=UPI003872829E
KRAYCLKTQPATGETYPKSDLFNKAFSYSNSNILIGLIRCFYERLMLLTIFAARLICINLEFDIVFPVIKSFEFWS